ncbi:response regulator [Clostridium estertheticum]|uniref:response regulator n=1 Tax=Clostridium estertheticum TaxID=238834 RepID=UPI0013E91F38|nr:response regulator [Clostridium estertheticum]MBZ9686526.1 response regulator [Clostridium estertheticum]
MYRMLLVEDEPIVRLALKSLVNWENYGFDEILEANNGKKALEILAKNPDIDIVITDMNMPVMNGIQLMEENIKLDNDTRFLVLSAYDDYELVRSAFKLGINDYILKTEMDPDKILKMVLSVLEGKKKKKKDIKLSKEELLRRLLIEELKSENLKNGNLRLENEYYVCLNIIIDNFSSVEKRYADSSIEELVRSVKNAANQNFEAMNNGEILVVSPMEYGIFLSFESLDEDGIYKKISEVISKLRYVLLNFLNVQVTIGISNKSNKIEHIRRLFEEAQKHSRLRFMFGKGKDIFPQQVKELDSIKKKNNLTKKTLLEMGKEEGLLKSIDNLDKEKAVEAIKQIFDIKELSKQGKVENIYIYYLEIVLMLFQYIMKMGENSIEEIIGEDIDFYSEIMKFETISEIEAWIIELLNKAIDHLSKLKQMQNRFIKEAKEYIQNNYAKKITLEDISKEVGFSKAYFSKIFVEETGDNFIAYLTDVRITNAKKFLDKTDMKIYEICDKVGYNNIEHFSRTFKKVVGISPLQYKNK